MRIMLYIHLRCDLIYKHYQSELIDIQDSLVMLGMMTVYIYLSVSHNFQELGFFLEGEEEYINMKDDVTGIADAMRGNAAAAAFGCGVENFSF